MLNAKQTVRFDKRKLKLIWKRKTVNFMRQWDRDETLPKHWHTTTHSTEASQLAIVRKQHKNPLDAFKRCRPEVDILPGITWKCSMRSAFSWFSEFCHSRRLSHFAASFIDTRAEGSIAKSCKRISKNPQTKKKEIQEKFEKLKGYLMAPSSRNRRPATATASYPRVLPNYFGSPHSKIQVWMKWIHIIV